MVKVTLDSRNWIKRRDSKKAMLHKKWFDSMGRRWHNTEKHGNAASE